MPHKQCNNRPLGRGYRGFLIVLSHVDSGLADVVWKVREETDRTKQNQINLSGTANITHSTTHTFGKSKRTTFWPRKAKTLDIVSVCTTLEQWTLHGRRAGGWTEQNETITYNNAHIQAEGGGGGYNRRWGMRCGERGE